MTDSIIRRALNLDGSNMREKGLYFDMSEVSHIEFKFQRSTDIEKLEEELGRQADSEEIEQAKRNAYTVDYVFCDRCEKIFTEIETAFIEKILPLLRGSSSSEKEKFISAEVKTTTVILVHSALA
ncbi:hypothetical protein JMN32_06815 [Fulvivirga sp. 29W222]|uniref:Uncharacterized protein n=1 Tax=Fulvivirga marina TaxID=2494733 RepID=A0A937KD96_9BACT|nr:hypothetical protein [Fulvivirga marina]MBL6446013.1 hypothetical protein [Fulvivirga marina]